MTVQSNLARSGQYAVKVDRVVEEYYGLDGGFRLLSCDAADQVISFSIDALLENPTSAQYSHWTVLGAYLLDVFVHVNTNWDGEIHSSTFTGSSTVLDFFGFYGQWDYTDDIGYFDDFSMKTDIPEPSVLSLMGLGLGALAFAWRRRRH